MKLAQCWDDGNVDDIRLIEILRKYQAKASFNLNFDLHAEERRCGWKYRGTKEVFKLAKGELKSVYEGFLVANHTLTHPHLTQIPIEQAAREIREGREKIEQHFGYAVKGFAYPFGEYNPAVQEAVRASGHVYARTVVSVPEIFPSLDPTAFHANCHFLAPDFWEKFEHVKSGNGTFYFWGHSYEIITEDDWKNYEDKIARLSREGEWVNLPDLFV
jgi:peptidoglycan-N-acetylglucosamine deacetylase